MMRTGLGRPSCAREALLTAVTLLKVRFLADIRCSFHDCFNIQILLVNEGATRENRRVSPVSLGQGLASGRKPGRILLGAAGASRYNLSSILMSVRYSIILPAYNEAERIEPSLRKAVAFVRQQGWDAEIVVVNDGSRDATAEVVRRLMAEAPELRMLENPGNHGKGYSVRNGMLNAGGEILLFSDADFSSPIQESLKLVAAIENGADVAFGSRWLLAEMQTKRQSLLRQFVGRAYNLLLRLVLGLPYKDTQCGFKACTRRAAEVVFTRQQIEGWGFDPELLFIARKFKLRLTEVPVEWANDERSKINPLVDGVKMFGELLSIRLHSLAGHYNRPTFQFFAGTAGTVLVRTK